MGSPDPGQLLSCDIPARLDNLAWSRWHWRVVLALGITWMLDGLEVTIVGALGSVLQEPETLGLTATQVGLVRQRLHRRRDRRARSLFGHLADRHGRKRLFLVTLALYVARDRRHRLLGRLLDLRGLPLLHRHGHRRRVRRHQLGDRRADPRARARRRRPGDQRQLLARHRARRGAELGAARSARARARLGLPRRVRRSAPCSRSASCSCGATCPSRRAG